MNEIRRNLLACALWVLLVAPSLSLADGKFFVIDETPVGVPYQRVLLTHDGTDECLVLQSEYQVSEGSPAANIAWVVPVPSIPELGSLSPKSASTLFDWLAYSSIPDVTKVSHVLALAFLIGLPAAGIIGFLLCLVSLMTSWPTWVSLRRGLIVIMSGYLLCALPLWAFILFHIFFAKSAGFNGAGVDVVKHQQVGVYDVHVVTSGGSATLIEWLRKGGFHFGQEDQVVFDHYIDQDWYFVAARVNAGEVHGDHELTSEGLVAPLVVRFAARQPIYPLALTSITGRATELLIYVLSPGKVTCDDRLRTSYYGPLRFEFLSEFSKLVEPPGLLPRESSALNRLTKFKGILSHYEMKKDLVFSPAADNEPVREHIVVW